MRPASQYGWRARKEDERIGQRNQFWKLLDPTEPQGIQ